MTRRLKYYLGEGLAGAGIVFLCIAFGVLILAECWPVILVIALIWWMVKP